MMLHASIALVSVWALFVQSISAHGSGSYNDQDSSHDNSYDNSQDGAYSSWGSVAASTYSTKVDLAASSSWSLSPFSSNTDVAVASPPLSSTASDVSVRGPSSASTTSIAAATSVASSSSGNTVVYNWNIGWVTAAPDGVARAVIGVNGEWPCPKIDVMLGDRVVVNVYNGLGNESTSLHWHGIHQRGTNHMDGSTGATQCPIPPGSSFTYEWTADQAGTYWWHSHNMGQYPDGLWGPLIVRDPNPPFEYDEELIITMSDWYHEEMPYLLNQYQSHAGEAEDGTPVPSGGALINSGKNTSIHVKPSTTYLVRLICPAAFSGHGWIFEGHNQTTVEVDGVYTEQVEVGWTTSNVRIAPGQRQAFLLRTKDETDKNYAFLDFQDPNMLFINKGLLPPADYPLNATGWLVYNTSAPYPDPPVLYDLDNQVFFDDLDLVPLDRQPVLEPVDHQIVLDMDLNNITGISRFVINNYTYLGASVPSLYTALTVDPDTVSDPTIYGNTNPFVFKYNEVVEVVINNKHSNLHPMHLHGHQFQVLERTWPNNGSWPGYYKNIHQYPVRRDTIMLQNDGYAVIRFRADNPGIWLFHCHIEFHVESGFSAIFVEAPDKIASSGIKIPQDHIDACKAYPMDYSGNAAGNDYNALNLTGAPSTVPQAQWGAIYPPKDSQASG